MSGYHVVVEALHSEDEQAAGEVARALCEAYPGHPWHINIGEGLIIIKHMGLSAKWGMVRKYNVIHDAKRLKSECVMAAGEFLERAHLRRGSDTGERNRLVEGIPTKDLVIG